MSVFFRRRDMVFRPNLTLSGKVNSSYGIVYIDGKRRKETGTFKVSKGTSVRVRCTGFTGTYQKNAKITFNGTLVSKGTSDAAAEYTFTVTDNCSVYISYKSNWATAAITMPA